MTKEQIINNLKEKFNIITTNVYPKKVYLRKGEDCVGLFSEELDSDFYFYHEFQGLYYKIEKCVVKDTYPSEEFQSRVKYQITKENWIELTVPEEGRKEEVEYKELEDANISELTIRDLYAIIQETPCSNKKFLNRIIEEGYRR